MEGSPPGCPLSMWTTTLCAACWKTRMPWSRLNASKAGGRGLFDTVVRQ